ncbi:hypothetical protein CDV31_015944 [Fusarium ambrosium]|uniref:SGNH hydrolase-type esterase domain-containing protein n=1 Tax=Fusarium ambrosium TaxID=131363 RepID=A0A428SH75_9HYPO|nr:hypothetical protein CDV31_015944 [Fusarium ambrosium]
MPQLQTVVLLLFTALASVSVAAPPPAGSHPTDTLRIVARDPDYEHTPSVVQSPSLLTGEAIEETPSSAESFTKPPQSHSGQHTNPWSPPTLTIYTSIAVPTRKPNSKPNPSCRSAGGKEILQYQKTQPGRAIKDGVKLRILCVGDSITAGFGDTDGNGYRQQLRKDLSKNQVVWAGTQLNENSGMADGYHAGFPGKTIKYISNHVGPSLKQRPNIILLAAGTNDMNSNTSTIAVDGNDPRQAAGRLGNLIDKITEECPDAVVLVSIIINTCDSRDMHTQRERTKQYQKLIPGIVRQRQQKGKHVMAVDFSRWEEAGDNLLRDCVHPTDDAYDLMGDWWYSFITQVDEDWIQEPQGSDPYRGNN